MHEGLLNAIHRSNATGLPYGDVAWTERLAKRRELDLTIRPRGWPRKAGNEHVMLDLAMPGGNGYALASRLRTQAGLHAVRIVAISGYNDDPARRAAAGIDAHLMKPASLHQLMEFFDCEPLELAL